MGKMAEKFRNKRRNGKLSLYPLKFEKAVKEILKVKSPRGDDKDGSRRNNNQNNY